MKNKITIKDVRSKIQDLHILTHFLMPIQTELSEEEAEELEILHGEYIIRIEEQSHETFKAAECLQLAYRWCGTEPVKEMPSRVSDVVEDAPKQQTNFPLKMVEHKLKEMSYIDKVDYLIAELSGLIIEIQNNTKLFPVDNSFRIITYLNESFFWLGWELERVEFENEEDNLN